MSKDDRRFKLCAVLDSETTTIGSGGAARAFPVLYQVNDLRNIDIRDYRAGATDDIRFYRRREQLIGYFEGLIAWGAANGLVPIVTAYNAPFDLCSLRDWLESAFDGVNPLARSSSVYYVLDCERAGGTALRFWDCAHLQRGGVRTMGALAGVPKATGDWDYTLIRTPETPLTNNERFYASRDVQVIPAFFAYLLKTNDWLESDMLGSKILTSTGMVRKWAALKIGSLPVCRQGETLEQVEAERQREEQKKVKKRDRRHELTVRQQYMRFYVAPNRPHDYHEYAARKACFRGGWSFTAARWACTVQRNVRSLDATSMHHTFFPMDVPVGFKPFNLEKNPVHARSIVGYVLHLTAKEVTAHYKRPFPYGLHACVRFTNLRLKKGTVFEKEGIGLLAEAKFKGRMTRMNDEEVNEATVAQTEAMQATGYGDRAYSTRDRFPVFAFAKLMSAPCVDVWLSEIELWCVAQVYDFDTFRVLGGEWTDKWSRCPAYLALQSMSLYGQKDCVKQARKTYRESHPFAGDLSGFPLAYRERMTTGDLSQSELDAYFKMTKSRINSIYGTQAMDEFKAGFVFTDGLVKVDGDKIVTPDNWEQLAPDYNSVFYNFGLRIVGRSRMHLLLAMLLLDEAFGVKARILGGDTDSLKIAFAPDVTATAIEQALKPLHDASDRMINRAYARLRAQYPAYSSHMRGVGHFEIEQCGSDEDGNPAFAYPLHIEMWVKCRVSVDKAGAFHITCAGLPHGKGYNIESWYADAARTRGAEWALTHGLWFNVTVDKQLTRRLQRKIPPVGRTFDAEVIDYNGQTAFVDAVECQALYNAGCNVGAIDTGANAENAAYLSAHYGRDVFRPPTRLCFDDWRR